MRCARGLSGQSTQGAMIATRAPFGAVGLQLLDYADHQRQTGAQL